MLVQQIIQTLLATSASNHINNSTVRTSESFLLHVFNTILISFIERLARCIQVVDGNVWIPLSKMHGNLIKNTGITGYEIQML